MITREELWSMAPRELHEVLRAGGPVADAELADADFRGVSLGLPRILERATWKTFRKSFRREGDRVRGFNVKVEQRGIDAPSAPKRSRGRDVTFGPYAVRALPEDGTPFRCRSGVVLDYGVAHPAWHPLARVRDVLVSVAGARDLFLGALYVEGLGASLRTPSFFTLERES
jgi:hypothetical protein